MKLKDLHRLISPMPVEPHGSSASNVCNQINLSDNTGFILFDNEGLTPIYDFAWEDVSGKTRKPWAGLNSQLSQHDKGEDSMILNLPFILEKLKYIIRREYRDTRQVSP